MNQNSHILFFVFLLSTKVAVKISQMLKILKITMFCDSKITLAHLNKLPSSQKVYVASCLVTIQKLATMFNGFPMWKNAVFEQPSRFVYKKTQSAPMACFSVCVFIFHCLSLFSLFVSSSIFFSIYNHCKGNNSNNKRVTVF